MRKRWVSKSPLGYGYVIACSNDDGEEVLVRFDEMDDAIFFMGL